MKNFKQVFEHKQEILRNRPDKTRVEVSASSKLVEGFRSHVKTRDFEVIVDQPDNMGSTDQGPRPSEYVLAALAACHEVTYRLYADAMEIDLKEIAVSVTGISDAKGFFNLDEDTPAGFSEVVGTINVVSDASDEDLERLRHAVNKHCPVLDDLRKPVKVELALQRNDPGSSRPQTVARCRNR
ncbi:MAG: OsmC family protein [Gammaproteobacteria bacterium]|nr:OsmC family protein [Gammaproteobacteria bacterium]